MAGRGRLSSLDLLPDEAQDDLVWAIQQLAERKRTQEDIRFEFNDRLEAKGIEGVSRSAFHRKALRLASAQRRLAESRALFQGLAPQFTADTVDESNIVLGEMIKTLIQELLVEESVRDPKGTLELSRAYQSTVSAMKVSSERRQKLLEEMRATTAKAIDAVAGERGMTADTVAAIKRKILGVKA